MRLCIDGKEHNLTMKVDSWNDVEIQANEAAGEELRIRVLDGSFHG